jgi:hypothetical protein
MRSRTLMASLCCPSPFPYSHTLRKHDKNLPLSPPCKSHPLPMLHWRFGASRMTAASVPNRRLSAARGACRLSDSFLVQPTVSSPSQCGVPQLEATRWTSRSGATCLPTRGRGEEAAICIYELIYGRPSSYMSTCMVGGPHI